MNVFEPADVVNEEPGYRFRRLRLGHRLGMEKLGATVFEVDPGERTWPYHWHHANEEMALVLEGELVLEEPAGERTLAHGDAVVFRTGRDGAHLFRNDGAVTARLLMVSTNTWPDMTEYPRSGKIGLFGPYPFGSEDGSREMWVPLAAEVDYWTGEKVDGG